MDNYSVAISIYGWTIKHKLSGKTRSGTMDQMPDRVYFELMQLMNISERAICTAREVFAPLNGVFSNWFRTTI